MFKDAGRKKAKHEDSIGAIERLHILKSMLVVGEAQNMVEQWYKRMGRPCPESPIVMNDLDPVHVNLVVEEAYEAEEAWADGSREEFIDALCDLIWVTLGAAGNLGVNLAPFFGEVAKANFAKVGGPTRSDGKFLKPDGWIHPDIGKLYREIYE